MKKFLLGLGIGTGLGWFFHDTITVKLHTIVDYSHETLDNIDKSKNSSEDSAT